MKCVYAYVRVCAYVYVCVRQTECVLTCVRPENVAFFVFQDGALRTISENKVEVYCKTSKWPTSSSGRSEDILHNTATDKLSPFLCRLPPSTDTSCYFHSRFLW